MVGGVSIRSLWANHIERDSLWVSDAGLLCWCRFGYCAVAERLSTGIPAVVAFPVVPDVAAVAMTVAVETEVVEAVVAVAVAFVAFARSYHFPNGYKIINVK